MLPIPQEPADLVTFTGEILNRRLYFLCSVICMKDNKTFIFIFLCNPQKSRAFRVCVAFLQITQNLLTKDISDWLELITEVLSFLQIFTVRKATSKFF